MGVQLNTGDTGKPVSAEADGSLYRNIFGDGFFVLESGNKFKAEIQSNNKIKIYDGDAIMQGRHIYTPPNDSTTVTIDNGAQGKNRIDLIVMRYKKSNTGIENAELVVIKGKETNEVPEEPETVDGNILLGETTKECVMYAVKLNGINITSVDKKFKTLLINMSKLTECLKDYIVEQGKQLIPNTNRYNYYEKYASGKLVQWGVANYSYTDGFGRITYPIPFSGSTDNYMLFVQGQYMSGKVVEIMVASKTTVSQGYAYSRYTDNSKPDTHNFDWYAIGRWK